MSTPSNWTCLELFPFTYATIDLINDDQIFGIPTKNHVCTDSDGIYVFSHNKNKWTKQISFNSDFICYAQTSAYDPINRLLYVWQGEHRDLLQFDLTKNKFISSIKIPCLNSGDFGRMVYVNDTLHFICMMDNKHYILEHKTNTIKQLLQRVTSFDKLAGHGLIYLKQQERVLLFGGQLGFGVSVNTVYQFSISDKKWNKLDVEIPVKVSKFGIVVTQNERYIIILGGKYSDSIFIYDTKINSFYQSKVFCPIIGYSGNEAVITTNRNSDKLLAFGYVNECYKGNNFKNVQKLPYYLIELINRWVCIQYIHLFQVETGKHWKINVDDVLTSMG